MTCCQYLTLFFVVFSSVGQLYAADKNCSDAFAKLANARVLDDGELTWGKYDCKQCKTVGVSAKPNKAGKQVCPNCGIPHTDEVFYAATHKRADGTVVASENSVVKDKDELKRAKSGDDWHCGYCSTTNFASDVRCGSCGAPKDSQAPAPKLVMNTKKEKVAETPTSGGKLKYIAGGAVAVAGGAYWALSTKPHDAKVTKLNWRHTTHHERFTPVSMSDWRDHIAVSTPRMPVNGQGESAGAFNIRNCREEFFMDETYQCGTQIETYQEAVQVLVGQDCNSESQGNGSFRNVCTPRYSTSYETRSREVPKYCTRPIYKTRCDYDTYQWVEIDVKVMDGNVESQEKKSLPWPKINLQKNDRERRDEVYETHFSYTIDGKEGHDKVKVSNEQEFLSWNVNEIATIYVRNIGGVDRIEKKKN